MMRTGALYLQMGLGIHSFASTLGVNPLSFKKIFVRAMHCHVIACYVALISQLALLTHGIATQRSTQAPGSVLLGTYPWVETAMTRACYVLEDLFTSAPRAASALPDSGRARCILSLQHIRLLLVRLLYLILKPGSSGQPMTPCSRRAACMSRGKPDRPPPQQAAGGHQIKLCRGSGGVMEVCCLRISDEHGVQCEAAY